MKKVMMALLTMLLIAFLSFQNFNLSQVSVKGSGNQKFKAISLVDLVQLPEANAECNAGHDSYGEQYWACGWELVCDHTDESFCCFGRDDKPDCP